MSALFLVRDDRRDGSSNFVFLPYDPREDGYSGDVETGISLDDPDDNNAWPQGAEAVLGQAPDDPKHFRVFKYRKDLQRAGYIPMEGRAMNTFGSWGAYYAFQYPAGGGKPR